MQFRAQLRNSAYIRSFVMNLSLCITIALYISMYFHITTSIYILISYSYCRVDNMLSKCFAVIIPLLSCQLTLIHTQSL